MRRVVVWGFLGLLMGACGSPDPAAERFATVCPGFDVGERTLRFLDAWTTGEPVHRNGVCVISGRAGPAPDFDTSSLGPERATPTDLPSDEVLMTANPHRERVDGYPVVHLGAVPETDGHALLEWNHDDRTRAPVACVEGACGPDEIPSAGGDGVVGVGRGGTLLVLTVWVADAASAVALEVGDEPVLWQRPVARVAQLVVDDHAPLLGRPYTVRVLDREGAEIAAYQGTFD